MDLKSGDLYRPDTFKNAPSYPRVEESKKCMISGAGFQVLAAHLNGKIKVQMSY
ncbi:hypothetical protein [Domibacillus epiphyticus]|uniref:hypothetical protein n=1 Tax=Domibacillus epiphyticus TaxID=1714355 RepID=UPI0013019A6C|nr:hypothetical protein [Domibacillus epiphyticus]